MKTIVGNLVACKTGILVHGVNCQGVMGSGIALQFKNMYPQIYDEYKATIKGCNGFVLGEINIVEINPELFIVNAFTQEYYGRDPKVRYASYDAINKCFESIAESYQISPIRHKDIPVRFPLIGCGKGNANWNVVKEIILSNLEGIVDPDCIELWIPHESFIDEMLAK